MDFIPAFLFGFASGVALFIAIKAVIAFGSRRAAEHQARVDAEIDRLHK